MSDVNTAIDMVLDRLKELETALESRARRFSQDYRAACLMNQGDLTNEQIGWCHISNRLWDVSGLIVSEAIEQLTKARDKGMMEGDVADVVARIERGEIRH